MRSLAFLHRQDIVPNAQAESRTAKQTKTLLRVAELLDNANNVRDRCVSRFHEKDGFLLIIR